MIDLLNVFINKLIFNQAVYLRFIVPLTLTQLKESRGGQVREQLSIIQKMINTDHSMIADSIFPVLLKVKPGKADTDIDEYRNILSFTFDKYIEVQRKQAVQDQMCRTKITPQDEAETEG